MEINQNDKIKKSGKDRLNNGDNNPRKSSNKHDFYDEYNKGNDWELRISKHKLRNDIWKILNTTNELNVTQISKRIQRSKSTVSRVLKSMEDDELLVSRRGKMKVGERERIPPKYYRIHAKFKK